MRAAMPDLAAQAHNASAGTGHTTRYVALPRCSRNPGSWKRRGMTAWMSRQVRSGGGSRYARMHRLYRAQSVTTVHRKSM